MFKKPTPEQIIKKQQEKLTKSFNIFKKLHDEIIQANKTILDAHQESERRKEALLTQLEHEQLTQEDAVSKIMENEKVLDKLQDFVPKND